MGETGICGRGGGQNCKDMKVVGPVGDGEAIQFKSTSAIAQVGSDGFLVALYQTFHSKTRSEQLEFGQFGMFQRSTHVVCILASIRIGVVKVNTFSHDSDINAFLLCAQLLCQGINLDLPLDILNVMLLEG